MEIRLDSIGIVKSAGVYQGWYIRITEQVTAFKGETLTNYYLYYSKYGDFATWGELFDDWYSDWQSLLLNMEYNGITEVDWIE